jgi:hypothetical protein
MGRLVAMLLSGGAGPGGVILKPETLRRMLELHKPLGPGLRSGLGLGFIVGEYRGVRYAGHSGSLPAGATDLELLPDHGLGWNIAFNGRGYNGTAAEARAILLRAVIERFLAPRAERLQARGRSTAADAAGLYLSTRRPHSGPARMFDLLGLATANAHPDGTLTIEREGSESRWLPHGVDRFVHSSTDMPLALSRDKEGKVSRLASPFLNNVAEFERAPLADRLGLPIVAFGVPILLVGGIVRLAGRLRRRRPEHQPPKQGFGRTLAALGVAAPWLMVAASIAWPLSFMAGFANAPGVNFALHLLSLLALAGAVALIFEAAADAVNVSVPLRRRLGKMLAAVCASALAYLLIAFDLTVF